VTDDPVLAAVQRFIDGVRSQVARQADELRGLLTETRSALADMQTRAAEIQPQRGPQGERGESGERGADGAPGRDGVDGKDGARGEQGERGADGLAGRDGSPGPQGERGDDGLIGPAGPMGERGADGLAGRDGAPGERGERGERGADGIATLEELDARIEARFAELQVRTLADYHQRTFERGTHYKRGAIVAWGGATHLAMADTDVVPGTSPDWQMLAKPGRDGRDRK
jgi:hypothetical protein